MTGSSHIQRLVAVVTTFNRLDQIQVTLKRLLDEKCAVVLVVDNGSTDGTREWLSSLNEPRLRTVFPDGNLGGAGGFELGMRTALADHTPDWVVVMDDDARPYSGAFQVFLDSNKDGWGAISAAVYYPDGEICEMNRPSKNPFWHLGAFLKTALGGGRQGFHITDSAYSGSEMLAVDAASFVGMFISAETLRNFGFPDARLFIYGDDVLYSLRIRKAGVRIGFNPSIKFAHDCSTFTGKTRAYKPLWKAYYNYRNGLMSYRAAAGIFFPAVLLVVIPKWFFLGRHYGNDRRIFNHLLWRALRDGLFSRTDLSHPQVLDLVKTLDRQPPR